MTTLIRTLAALPGLLLFALSLLLLIPLVEAMFSNRPLTGSFMVLTLLLAFLWLIYMQWPRVVTRRAVRGLRTLSRKKRKEHR